MSAFSAHDAEEAGVRFSYHRGIAPMLWVLVGLSVIEMAAVHLFLLLWWPALGLVLSAASLIGIFWIVRLIRSMPGLPVMIGGGRLLMRTGRFLCIETPLDNVAGLRSAWTLADLKPRDVARLSLIAHPNIVIDLHRAVSMRRGRMVRTIAHRLDDPAGFVAALTDQMLRDGQAR